MPSIAEQIVSAPGVGLDKFLAAANGFLGRINLEFGLRESLDRPALEGMLAQLEAKPLSYSATQPAYSRRLLYASPQGHYSLALIEWPAGARTPVHSHYTWCTFLVTEGVLTERRFSQRLDASHRLPQLDTTTRLGCGAFRSDERFGGVHQLVNDADSPAVSLHCYGVSGAQATTHVNRVYDCATAP